jgi:uncharacterized membrane protein
MNWSMLLLLLVSIIFCAFGALFLKKGSIHFKIDFTIKNIINILKNYTLIIGVLFYCISTIFFILALRLGELSVVYPLSSITYVIITVLSMYFLKEKINRYKLIGIVLIIFGVVLISL